MSDKIVGIEGGKKDNKADEWDFHFTMKDGSEEIYRGEFVGTSPMLPGFLQVIPKEGDAEDGEITLIAIDIVSKVTTEGIKD